MAIRVVETRKQALPVWADVVGSYSPAEIAAAVQKAEALPAAPTDPNMVEIVFPLLVMPVTAAALDFGAVTQVKVQVGSLIASQSWLKLDRLIKHINEPGTRGDDNPSPFVSLPIIAEGNIIIDGHHSLTALWLLAGSDLEVPVWQLPIGIATGHPRG